MGWFFNTCSWFCWTRGSLSLVSGWEDKLEEGFFLLLLFYLFLAALGLRCCMRPFSSCGERGVGFSLQCLCCGARALGAWASVVVALGLSSCGSRALEHRLGSCDTWA